MQLDGYTPRRARLCVLAALWISQTPHSVNIVKGSNSDELPFSYNNDGISLHKPNGICSSSAHLKVCKETHDTSMLITLI